MTLIIVLITCIDLRVGCSHLPPWSFSGEEQSENTETQKSDKRRRRRSSARLRRHLCCDWAARRHVTLHMSADRTSPAPLCKNFINKPSSNNHSEHVVQNHEPAETWSDRIDTHTRVTSHKFSSTLVLYWFCREPPGESSSQLMVLIKVNFINRSFKSTNTQRRRHHKENKHVYIYT